MVTLKSKVTQIGDQHETLSSSESSRTRFKLDEGMTKGEFIHMLKELGDYRLLDSFLASRRKELQTRGLQAASTSNHFPKIKQKELHDILDWAKWLYHAIP